MVGRPARRRPAAVDILASLAGLGLGVTIGFGLNAETMSSVSTVAGAAGRSNHAKR